jgi:hypothetical protein
MDAGGRGQGARAKISSKSSTYGSKLIPEQKSMTKQPLEGFYESGA